MKYVAVVGCTLDCDDGEAVVTSKPSSFMTVDNKGVYCGPMSVTVSSSSAGGADSNAMGSGIINPTSSFVDDAAGNNVILEGDQTTVTVIGTNSKGDSTEGTVTVTVSKAGQTFFLAE